MTSPTLREALEACPHPSVFIREERKARGWSELNLAYRMGDDPQMNLMALHMYEHTGPTARGLHLGVEMAEQLSKAFGVSAAFFLALETAWLAAPSHEAGRRAGLDIGEFEIWQMVGEDEMMVAGCSGKLDRALADAMHYAAVYGQDGPVRLEQIIRVSIALPPAIRNLAGDEGNDT